MQDGRLSYVEARARGLAMLELQSQADVSVTYTTRDRNTRSGKAIVVDLPSPTSVDDTFKIQQVTTSGFCPALMPTRSASASNVRYAFEDMLRQVRRGNT